MSMQLVTIDPAKLIVGDIATFPYVQQDNKPLRIEHWDVAINHGRSAANHIVKGDAFEGICPLTLGNCRIYFYGILLVCTGKSDALCWNYSH